MKHEKIDETIDKYLIASESTKSQFVAKLIGLGVLTKTKDGKLKKGKNKASKEEVISKLKKSK